MASHSRRSTKSHGIRHLQEVKIVNLVLCKCHHNFLKKGAKEDDGRKKPPRRGSCRGQSLPDPPAPG